MAEGKKKFEKAVEWGMDLQSEHERYLAEVVYQKPVIVYNYPKVCVRVCMCVLLLLFVCCCLLLLYVLNF